MKTINLEPDDGDHGRGLRRVTPPRRAFCSSSFPCTCVDSVYFALKAPKKKQHFLPLLLLGIICKDPHHQAWWIQATQPSSPDNKSTIKPTEQQRKHVAGCVFPGFSKTAEPLPLKQYCPAEAAQSPRGLWREDSLHRCPAEAC